MKKEAMNLRYSYVSGKIDYPYAILLVRYDYFAYSEIFTVETDVDVLFHIFIKFDDIALFEREDLNEELMHFSHIDTYFELDIAKKFELRIYGILHTLLLCSLNDKICKIDVFNTTDRQNGIDSFEDLLFELFDPFGSAQIL